MSLRRNARAAAVTAAVTATLVAALAPSTAQAATTAPGQASAAASSVAQRDVAAPDVVSLTAREYQTTSMFGVVLVAVDMTVPEGTTIDSVEVLLAVNGVEKGWTSLSFGKDPSNYAGGELLWSPSRFGVGDAQLLRSRVTYKGADGKQQVVEDEAGSNPFRVLQESRMTGTLSREGKKVNFYLDVEYYSAKDGGFENPTGTSVIVEKQTGPTWKKVGTIPVDSFGSARKAFKAPKKTAFRLTWPGDKFTAPVERLTDGKV